MSEWKPIETAPRDGTPILVSWHDGLEPRPRLVCFHQYWKDYLGGWGYDEKNILGWLEIPEPSKKKHFCKSKNRDWFCKTNENTGEGLILVDYRGVWSECIICPFCGEKA